MCKAATLSQDLERFAREMEFDGPSDYAATPEGALALRVAVAGMMRMFAIDAQALEARLATSEARIACLMTTDYAGDLTRDVAIIDGVKAGKVIDLRDVFLDEHGFNAGRHENDGDAA